MEKRRTARFDGISYDLDELAKEAHPSVGPALLGIRAAHGWSKERALREPYTTKAARRAPLRTVMTGVWRR